VEESGRIMDSIIIDRRSYLTSPSQTPHSMDYILLHIILTEGLILYVISYNPLHHISSCLLVRWGLLIRRGTYNDTLLGCELIIYRNVDYRNAGYDK
jgi:hypothetical protein